MFNLFINIVDFILNSFVYIFLGIVLACILFVSGKAFGAEPLTCEAYAKDIGHITGIGDTPWDAQGNAATICFERRVQLHEQVKKEIPSEERSLLYIDSCINIECKRGEK